MPKTRDTEAVKAWRALLVAFTGIHNELGRELQEECSLPIEHYEILLMLYEAGGDGLRPSDIAERRRLSRSGATRLIDRLEQDDLVERRACGQDRRGSLVALTSVGQQVFTTAGRIHLDGIERYVGSKLSRGEMVALRDLLAKISLEEDPASS